jgi:hypothetical protein
MTAIISIHVLLFRSLLTFRSILLWNSYEATPPKGGIEECKLIGALRTGIPLRILVGLIMLDKKQLRM